MSRPRILRSFKTTAVFSEEQTPVDQGIPPAVKRKLPPPQLLILEHPGPKGSFFRELGVTNDAPLESTRLKEISEAVLTFRREVVFDATNMEISLLKPLDLKVSKERYEQLRRELDASFTCPQLRDYYVADTESPVKVPAIRKQAVKHELLKAILREKWGVQVAEEISEWEDVITSQEIQSNRREIFFLIGHDGRVLRDWAHRYSARITVNVKDSTINLEASRANIERITKEMQVFFEDTLEEVIDLSVLSRLGGFNETLITPIAWITGTFIEPTTENNLRISALGSDRCGNLDDARRLLFTSLDLHFRTKYSLLYSPSSNPDLPGALYPIYEDKSLPWRFRDRNWARWRNVKTKQASTTTVFKNLLGTAGKRKVKRENYKFVTPSKGEPCDVHEIRQILDAKDGKLHEGSEQTRVSYEAILAYILHSSIPGESTPGESTPQPIHDFISTNYQRVLCSNVPGSMHLTDSLDPSPSPSASPPTSSTSAITAVPKFTLTFSPSPWKYPRSFESYPSLLMTLSVDPTTGTPRNPVVEAVHRETVADVMVPAGECDVRFVRTEKVKIDVRKEEIESWLQESRLDIFDSGSLRPRPELKVPIPAWMRTSLASSPSTSSSTESSNSDDKEPSENDDRELSESDVELEAEFAELEAELEAELVELGARFEGRGAKSGKQDPRHQGEVDYLYTTMEFRRELSFPIDCGHLLYSIVEGGMTGGRRIETKLVCSKQILEDGNIIVDSEMWEKFAEDVMGFVGKVGNVMTNIVGKGRCL